MPLFPKPQQQAATQGEDTQEAARRAEQQLALGIDSLRARRFTDAVAYLERAAEAHPDRAVIHNCLGVAYRSLGQLNRAIESYQKALRCDPDYFQACNNLGIAYEATGENEAAIAAYRKAIAIRDDVSAVHNNLGNALTKSGYHADAVKMFTRALQLQPNFPAALNNQGLALRELGRIDEAESSFRRAIQVQPNFAEAYVNLGNVFAKKEQIESAIECYRLAKQANPRFAPAPCCLGNALLDQRQAEQAVRCYEQALALSPNYPEAHFGLGNACRELGREDRAIAAFRSAVAHAAHYPEAYNNLGTLLAGRDEVEEAEACFKKAVQQKPDHRAAHNNLGNLYRLQDRLDEAADCYRQVLSRMPPHPLHQLRLSTLCPTVFPDQSAMDEYLESVQREWRSLEGVCSYRDLSELISVANEPPYNLQFFSNNIREAKETYARIFRDDAPGFDPKPTSGRIRLGLVVTSTHEIAFLRLIWDALRKMDQAEFELTILCTAGAADKFRTAVEGQAHVLALPDRPDEVVPVIRNAGLDILYYFEVCTDVINYFLPFFRLAPVQVTSWGIQVTSGSPNLDYYLSSKLVEPADAAEHYSETLVLAETLLTYQKPLRLPERRKTREWFGFSDDQNLYMCIQHLGKFHPDFDPMLADVLRNDPHGVIVAVEDRYGYGAKRLRERFRRTIPDVADRIVFLQRQAFPDYLSLLAFGDVALDAPHFSSVNTAYDAFSVDLPIVTLPSAFHRGRYTFGCYQRMGMTECVASGVDDYVEIATKLAGDSDQNDFVRQRIRETKHHIFEDEAAVREHERIFRQLVEKARAA